MVPAVSAWYGAERPVAYAGAADCSVWQATKTDPQVDLYFHSDAWQKLASGDWATADNPVGVENEIRNGVDQRFGDLECNPYSSTRPERRIAPARFAPRTGRGWTLRPRLPAQARGARNADGHMAVLQPNGLALETFATIRMSNGDVVCGFASYTDPTGSGDGRANGRRASMISSYVGVLSGGEPTTGIDHVMAVALGPEALAPTISYPALAFDSDCSDYGGAVPMGAQLAISPGVGIARADFQSEPGWRLALAAQNYGCIVVDRAGPGALIFCSATGAAELPAWDRAIATDLGWLVSQLMIAETEPLDKAA
jgi:hypothetical protein